MSATSSPTTPRIQSNLQKLGVVTHVDWVDDYIHCRDQYLVPSACARGGEVVKKYDPRTPVHVPRLPGNRRVEIWAGSIGNQPVGDSGDGSAASGDPNYFDWNRHASPTLIETSLACFVRAAPTPAQSEVRFPCRRRRARPYPAGTISCGAGRANAQFHHPTTASGIEDLPGGNDGDARTLGRPGRTALRRASTTSETGAASGTAVPAVWRQTPARRPSDVDHLDWHASQLPDIDELSVPGDRAVLIS